MAKLKISELSKQLLAVIYAQYVDSPGIILRQMEFSMEDGVEHDDENDSKIIKAMLNIVDGNGDMLIACLKYLFENGYISCDSFSQTLDGYSALIGVYIKAKGIDFAEGLIGGEDTNIKQAGIVVNGDVEFSLKLDSLFKATDLMGIGKLLKVFSSKN